MNIHLAIGGCIMKEMIEVILTDITKGCWKGMIMAGTKPKNNMRNFLKESFMKINNNGGK